MESYFYEWKGDRVAGGHMTGPSSGGGEIGLLFSAEIRNLSWGVSARRESFISGQEDMDKFERLP